MSAKVRRSAEPQLKLTGLEVSYRHAKLEEAYRDLVR